MNRFVIVGMVGGLFIASGTARAAGVPDEVTFTKHIAPIPRPVWARDRKSAAAG